MLLNSSTTRRRCVYSVALWIATATPAWCGVIPKSERETLIAIYLGTNGGQWVINNNWCDEACPASGAPRFNKRGTECTWFGVYCNNMNHVMSINLDSNGLQGDLPSLGALSELEAIDLPNNALSGPIPGDIVRIRTLFSVNFRSNQLTGPLPDFSGLQQLNEVDVTNNELSGEIGPFENLGGLQSLELSNNQFSGPLPSFFGLYRLTVILVDHNQFSGPVPDFSQSNMSIFWADHNQLSGPLPSLSDTMPFERHGTRLCPNPLSLEPGPYDGAWASAVGETPWWGPPGGGCDHIFSSTFDQM